MPAADPGADSAAYPYRVSLELLGGQLLVRCRYRRCRDGIAEYFSAAVRERPWRTPDVIVDCDWEQAGRYLFRARPDYRDRVLPGVRVHVAGRLATSDWNSREAPIPPMSVDPFLGRFVGLHAGAVVTPAGSALVYLGDKASGKTTTTVRLVNDYGCALLTDEAAFVHRRTRIVEPFPRSLGVADEYDRSVDQPATDAAPLAGESFRDAGAAMAAGVDREATGRAPKVPRPATVVCREVAAEPAPIGCLGFLTPVPEMTGAVVEPISPTEAVRLMPANQFDVSVSADEGMVTLLTLARRVPAVRCRYGSYQDLLKVAGLLLDHHDREAARD